MRVPVILQMLMECCSSCSTHRGLYAGSEVAEAIRRQVQEATHLTCSVGVAANRMLAKVASDMNKPNGQFVLPSEHKGIMQFTNSLSIRKVPGIGKVCDRCCGAISIAAAASLSTLAYCYPHACVIPLYTSLFDCLSGWLPSCVTILAKSIYTHTMSQL